MTEPVAEVHLADLVFVSAADALGLVLLCPGAVRYRQQAGGTGCRQRWADGAWLPLTLDTDDLAGELVELTRDYGRLEPPVLDRLDAVFAREGLPLRCLRSADAPPGLDAVDACEAFVPATIVAEGRHRHLHHLAGRVAVLMWENSD